MKRVACYGPVCDKRRKHHCNPDENRDRRVLEVGDSHAGLVFCSLECKAYWHGVRDEKMDGTPR